ncbi:MAG TPA: hypothetical protein VJW75_08565 [Candidatus Eisenbacteria bacterium]|nr:hypothetical protein [Candidatus Eisenbacteria bacterium]
MSTHRDHPHDELHLLLDGRLDVEARARVEERVRGCQSCRRELEAIRWAKGAVRGDVQGTAAPARLTERVLAALDEADRAGTAAPRRAVGLRPLVPALGLLVAAIAIVFLVGRPRVHDPVTAAGKDLESYAESTLVLDRLTGSPQELERFFAAEGMDFPTRVFDFGMMNFTLRGGRVHRIGGRPSALFAYSSAEGGNIVCQMYRGTLSDLPQGSERHVLGGVEFRAYRRGKLSLVFWQEGHLLCVLASDGDPAEALQFARAKAKAAGL